MLKILLCFPFFTCPILRFISVCLVPCFLTDRYLGCPRADSITGYILPQGCPVAAGVTFSGALIRMGLMEPGVVHPESL